VENYLIMNNICFFDAEGAFSDTTHSYLECILLISVAFVGMFGNASEEEKNMSALTIEQALENIYASLKNNNEEIDMHIGQLKAALAAGNQKTVAVDSARLVQNNRQGRKLMQSYFKKRGVVVTFSESA